MLSTPHSHAVSCRSDVEDRAHSTPNSRFDLRSILQEQQGILQKILSNQETIQKTQSSFEERLKKLESVGSTPASSSDTSVKKKQAVTRTLSVSYLNTTVPCTDTL